MVILKWLDQDLNSGEGGYRLLKPAEVRSFLEGEKKSKEDEIKSRQATVEQLSGVLGGM